MSYSPSGNFAFRLPNSDQLGEIGHEMFLRPEVSVAKTLDVGFVKRLEFQELAPQVVKWQLV